VDAELGLLGLVAGYRSNWVEGWGRMFGVVAAWAADRDGLVKSTEGDFVGARCKVQIPPSQQKENIYNSRLQFL
jgi:hypothetical protein